MDRKVFFRSRLQLQTSGVSPSSSIGNPSGFSGTDRTPGRWNRACQPSSRIRTPVVWKTCAAHTALTKVVSVRQEGRKASSIRPAISRYTSCSLGVRPSGRMPVTVMAGWMLTCFSSTTLRDRPDSIPSDRSVSSSNRFHETSLRRMAGSVRYTSSVRYLLDVRG